MDPALAGAAVVVALAAAPAHLPPAALSDPDVLPMLLEHLGRQGMHALVGAMAAPLSAVALGRLVGQLALGASPSQLLAMAQLLATELSESALQRCAAAARELVRRRVWIASYGQSELQGATPRPAQPREADQVAQVCQADFASWQTTGCAPLCVHVVAKKRLRRCTPQ
jgi:hypothetical protein